MEFYIKMIKRPAVDGDRFNHVWIDQVYPFKDEYEMTA